MSMSRSRLLLTLSSLLGLLAIALGVWFLSPGLRAEREFADENVRIHKYLCGGSWVAKCVKLNLRKQAEIEERLLFLGFSPLNVDINLGHFSLVILEAEKRYSVEHDLLASLAIVESALNSSALSNKGAMGLYQIMPATAAGLWGSFLGTLADDDRLHLLDPIEHSADVRLSALLGAYYISSLIREFNGDVDLALASYNVGPNKLRQAMTEGEKPGTQFVARIRQILANYRNPNSRK
jgi:hypothetical protein